MSWHITKHTLVEGGYEDTVIWVPPGQATALPDYIGMIDTMSLEYVRRHPMEEHYTFTRRTPLREEIRPPGEVYIGHQEMWGLELNPPLRAPRFIWDNPGAADPDVRVNLEFDLGDNDKRREYLQAALKQMAEPKKGRTPGMGGPGDPLDPNAEGCRK